MQRTEYSFLNNSKLYALTLFVTAATAILCNPSVASKGAFEGLKICSSVIIPALFPFTVIALFFQKSGGLSVVGELLNAISVKLFKISGKNFTIVLISLLGGYPIGAKMINEFYKTKEISKQNAKNLLKVCVNPSPAFYISVIGYSLSGSKQIGVFLFVSNIVACFFLLFLNRFSHKKQNTITPNNPFIKSSLSDSFVESVTDASKTIIYICGWVVFFSCLSAMLKKVITHSILSAYITAFLEISFGSVEICKIGVPFYIIAFLLSFGGLSTICQVKQAASTLNPSILTLVCHRIIHSITSGLVAFILFEIFPPTASVISNSVEIKFDGFPLFFPSLALLLMAVVFLAYLKPSDSKI